MSIAMGADSVGRVETIRTVAIERKCLPTVIKANYFGDAQIGYCTSVDPAGTIRLRIRGERRVVFARLRVG